MDKHSILEKTLAGDVCVRSLSSTCVTLCRVTMMCLGLDDKTVKFRI